jgi:hypothetical protein
MAADLYLHTQACKQVIVFVCAAFLIIHYSTCASIESGIVLTQEKNVLNVARLLFRWKSLANTRRIIVVHRRQSIACSSKVLYRYLPNLPVAAAPLERTAQHRFCNTTRPFALFWMLKGRE